MFPLSRQIWKTLEVCSYATQIWTLRRNSRHYRSVGGGGRNPSVDNSELYELMKMRSSTWNNSIWGQALLHQGSCSRLIWGSLSWPDKLTSGKLAVWGASRRAGQLSSTWWAQQFVSFRKMCLQLALVSDLQPLTFYLPGLLGSGARTGLGDGWEEIEQRRSYHFTTNNLFEPINLFICSL